MHSRSADIKFQLIVGLFLYACLVISYLIYKPGLGGMFLLDDFHNIVPTIMHEWDLDRIIQIALSNTSGILGRPIPTLSFSITSLLHGSGSYAFKMHNLAIHLLIGLLVFKFVYSITGIQQSATARFKLVTAASCAAIWLLHPLNLSTVLYSVQRMTQLATLFSLLAMTSYLSALQDSRPALVVWKYFGTAIFCILAMFSKESSALLPIFFVALHVYAGRHIRLIGIKKVSVWVFAYAPLLIGIVGAALIFERLTDYSGRDFTLYERLLSQIHFVTFYIKQILFPRLSEMGLYFDYYQMPSQLTLALAAKLALLSTLLISGVYGLLKGKQWGLGLSFFFIGHLMESTFIPLEVAFEHRNYMPMIGLLMCICSVVTGLRFSYKIKLIGLFLYLGLFAVILFTRAQFWSNQANWLQTITAYHPTSERARLVNAQFLARIGRDDYATDYYYESMQVLPNRLSFPVLYLLSACEDPDLAHKDEALARINHILETKNMTTVGFNAFSSLTQYGVLKNCKSLTVEEIEELVIKSIAEQDQRGSTATKPFLSVLLAQIKHHQKKHKESADLFMEGFHGTKRPKFAFWALEVLFQNKATQEEGLILLDRIKDGEFFNPRFHRHELKRFKVEIIRKTDDTEQHESTTKSLDESHKASDATDN